MNKGVADIVAGGSAWPRLRDLTCMAKLGVAALLFVVLGGLAVSGYHLYDHYQNRDETPGLSMNDIKGAYHGVSAPSPLLEAMKRGHPETLSQADRDALTKWMTSEKLSENYDNLDLGDKAPSEIMSRSCLECHSRKHESTQPIAKTIPLDYWDDIKTIAFSKDIQPGGIKVLAASAHAHSLSLATLMLVLSALLMMTGWPRALVGLLVAGMGVGLLVDLSCWFVAREYVAATYGIVVFGMVFNCCAGLGGLLTLIELCGPSRRGG